LVLTGVTGPVEADALEGPPVVVDSLVLPVEVGVLVEVDGDVDETVELEGETTTTGSLERVTPAQPLINDELPLNRLAFPQAWTTIGSALMLIPKPPLALNTP
jgi:hypothetical protein